MKTARSTIDIEQLTAELAESALFTLARENHAHDFLKPGPNLLRRLRKAIEKKTAILGIQIKAVELKDVKVLHEGEIPENSYPPMEGAQNFEKSWCEEANSICFNNAKDESAYPPTAPFSVDKNIPS